MDATSNFQIVGLLLDLPHYCWLNPHHCWYSNHICSLDKSRLSSTHVHFARIHHFSTGTFGTVQAMVMPGPFSETSPEVQHVKTTWPTLDASVSGWHPDRHHWYVYLSIYPSISIHPSIYLSIYPSIYLILSVCLSLSLNDDISSKEV